MALSFTVLLFSLAGIPPFAGFFAKMYVIQSALQGGYYLTSLIAVLGSVVSAGYYLKVIKAMYFDTPAGGDHALAIDKAIPKQTTFIMVLSMTLVTLYIVAPRLLSLTIATTTP